MKRKDLKLSAGKSVAVLFNRKRSNQECPNIKINNKKIMLDVKAKYLGLIMDRRLNWTTHIKGMVDKAKKRCFHLKTMSSKFNYHQ